MQLQRLIQKDLFASMTSTNSGDSEVIKLDYAAGFSVQAVYDVQTPAAVIVASAAIVFSTATWTSTAHGFTTGLKVRLTTSSALPAPLQLATDYFVIVVTANTFKLASSLALALAGTPVTLSDAGVGNQTVTPVALAGATIGFYGSNVEEGDVWTLLATATAITVDGSSYYPPVATAQPPLAYRRFKCVKGLTAGVVDLRAYVLVVGGTA